jgi:hypothetical protein
MTLSSRILKLEKCAAGRRRTQFEVELAALSDAELEQLRADLARRALDQWQSEIDSADTLKEMKQCAVRMKLEVRENETTADLWLRLKASFEAERATPSAL